MSDLAETLGLRRVRTSPPSPTACRNVAERRPPHRRVKTIVLTPKAASGRAMLSTAVGVASRQHALVLDARRRARPSSADSGAPGSARVCSASRIRPSAFDAVRVAIRTVADAASAEDSPPSRASTRAQLDSARRPATLGRLAGGGGRAMPVPFLRRASSPTYTSSRVDGRTFAPDCGHEWRA